MVVSFDLSTCSEKPTRFLKASSLEILSKKYKLFRFYRVRSLSPTRTASKFKRVLDEKRLGNESPLFKPAFLGHFEDYPESDRLLRFIHIPKANVLVSSFIGHRPFQVPRISMSEEINSVRQIRLPRRVRAHEDGKRSRRDRHVPQRLVVVDLQPVQSHGHSARAPRVGGTVPSPARGAGIKPGVSTPGQAPTHFSQAPKGRRRLLARSACAPSGLEILSGPSLGAEAPGFMPAPLRGWRQVPDASLLQ